jgi:hypothetical protein
VLCPLWWCRCDDGEEVAGVRDRCQQLATGVRLMKVLLPLASANRRLYAEEAAPELRVGWIPSLHTGRMTFMVLKKNEVGSGWLLW